MRVSYASKGWCMSTSVRNWSAVLGHSLQEMGEVEQVPALEHSVSMPLTGWARSQRPQLSLTPGAGAASLLKRALTTGSRFLASGRHFLRMMSGPRSRPGLVIPTLKPFLFSDTRKG
jgi:hypothetical protein